MARCALATAGTLRVKAVCAGLGYTLRVPTPMMLRVDRVLKLIVVVGAVPPAKQSGVMLMV